MTNADHRTPDEIERDIDDTRAELDATLDALQERLNPQAAMDQAIAYARENGGLFGRNLMEQVRDNPLPALLAGIGLTWLMTARDSGPSASRIGSSFGTVRHGMAGAASRAGHGSGGTAESMRGSADAARERMSGSAEAARERMSGSADAARSRMAGARNAAGARVGDARERMGAAYSGASRRAGDVYDRAGEMYGRAGDSLRSAGGYARDNPLMLGLAAAAVGVVAAAMMPRTRTEEEYYEPMRERVRDQARDVGEQAKGKAREASHRALDEAEHQIRKGEEKAEEKAEQARSRAEGSGGDGAERREAGRGDSGNTGSGPGAPRETSTSGLSDEERANRARTVAGNASRPGPLPEEEGRPGRETGAADTGWVRPAGGSSTAGRSNPGPGLSGSPGLDR